MPVGDLPGWRQVVAQDFNGGAVPGDWGAYSGQPGGNPDGWWDPSHVVVSNGDLVLRGYRDGGKFVTGGAMLLGQSQTYGKYLVRFRMDKAPGVKYALLLWPTDGNWPASGEIDFAEDGGGDRSTTTATLHYGSSNSQIARSVDADFSTWHTIGVEWTPGKLVYTLDGATWATVTTSAVPTGQMDLALQSEAVGGTPSSVTSADVQVDWVSVYARA